MKKFQKEVKQRVAERTRKEKEQAAAEEKSKQKKVLSPQLSGYLPRPPSRHATRASPSKYITPRIPAEGGRTTTATATPAGSSGPVIYVLKHTEAAEDTVFSSSPSPPPKPSPSQHTSSHSPNRSTAAHIASLQRNLSIFLNSSHRSAASARTKASQTIICSCGLSLLDDQTKHNVNCPMANNLVQFRKMVAAVMSPQ